MGVMTPELPPSDYSNFLTSIKNRVQQAQLKAVASVNEQLILLYWQIGRDILERQQQAGWGAKVIEKLSLDLHAAFAQMRGFSSRNLKYMRAFAEAYPDGQFVQTVSAQITWSHNTLILDKIKDPQERLWYIHQAAENGWSHSVLAFQIDMGLYQRQGKAITNFKATLPTIDSDLADNIFKDPYIFNFITTGEDENKERHLQSALVGHIRRFLLELGVGFTFVGSDYHLNVGGDDFYIDLLFYHIRLHCYVVIELKTGAFKPEHAGQLGFYMTAIDMQVMQSEDSPTIGLVLCKTKGSRTTVEYALRNMKGPIGVATYQTATALPDEYKDKLPSVEALEEKLREVND